MTEFLETLVTPVAQVALIIGIVEVIKKVGLNKKFIPLVDLAIGIIFGILIDGILLGYGVFSGVVIGLALGLSACGLFSGVKNLTKTEKDEDKTDFDA